MTATSRLGDCQSAPPHDGGCNADARIIAFYLPQFHPIPENDLWWGKGFTEWTNVRKARSNFVGHYQPHVPGELGYYDPRDADVREAQAALARAHGISGFCYYYYWFGGRRLLEQPLDAMLESERPDFPFCLCWANENWTRRWDGLDQEILVEQRYSREDSIAFIRGLLPIFADRRYIRVWGRPLLIVYKPDVIPSLGETVALWRDEARRAGSGELYLVGALTSWQGDPTRFGFDAAVEFPPHGQAPESVAHGCEFINPEFSGMVFNYRSYVVQWLTRARPNFKLFRTVVPGWDNTPRRQHESTIFVGSSPEIFGYWLERVIQQTRLRFRGDERLVFVNAWNEWGEGCHLEPDERYGRQYLEALAAARSAPGPEPAPERPPWTAVLASAETTASQARVVRSSATHTQTRADGVSVSVVMPAYNHERYVKTALDSVLAQTHRRLEIVVVDDGSTDSTGALLDDYAARCRSHPLTVVHQPNAGAHEAINRGLALARGEVVALINSDDLYMPTRLERLLAEMNRRGASFAFSNTRFIDEEGGEFEATDPYVARLRELLVEASQARDVLYALVNNNIAISSGNFLFRRELLERTGGFCAMRTCHDWDFILAASYETPIAFVDEILYLYRVHTTNTYAGARLAATVEADQVLARFLAKLGGHPIASDRAELARFLRHVERSGLGSYVPRGVTAAG